MPFSQGASGSTFETHGEAHRPRPPRVVQVQGAGPAQVLHRDDEEWPVDLLALKNPGAAAAAAAAAVIRGGGGDGGGCNARR